MRPFRAVLRRAGEVVDGVALPAATLEGCSGADVSIKDGEGNTVPGAAAKAVWDPALGILLADGELPEGADPHALHMELLVLAKEAAAVKREAGAAADAIIEKREKESQNIDDSTGVQVVEIWYDCRNWMRYIKTREREAKAQSDTGGDGWRHICGGMSCVEEGVAAFIGEDTYEAAKRAAKAARAFARVKNPMSPMSLQAENAYVLLLQRIHGEEPFAKGGRVVLPVKMLDEFVEVSQ